MRKFLFYILMAIGPHTSAASPECDWSVQVAKDESYRIDIRSCQIAQLNAAVAVDKSTLEKELLPLLEARNHAVSIYDFKSQTAKDSQVAVRQAILFVQETIISNHSLKALLETLKRRSQLSSDRGLADQLRDSIQHEHLSASAKERLTQLANAVSLVESDQDAWRKSEREILQSYLDGKTSLVEGLLQKLNELNEQLAFDLNELSAGYSRDEVSAAEAEKNVSDMQNKISIELNQIDANQKANEASRGYMQRWDVGRYCPRPSAEPPLSFIHPIR